MSIRNLNPDQVFAYHKLHVEKGTIPPMGNNHGLGRSAALFICRCHSTLGSPSFIWDESYPRHVLIVGRTGVREELGGVDVYEREGACRRLSGVDKYFKG